MQNYPLGQVGTDQTDDPLGVRVRAFKEQAHAPFTLTATVESDIILHFAALPEDFDPAMVEQLADGFLDFLTRVITLPNLPISKIFTYCLITPLINGRFLKFQCQKKAEDMPNNTPIRYLISL